MCPKCLSVETRSAPVSIACAAIQTSFVGIGRPLALNDAMILAYRSAVTGPTGTNDTYGLSRKDLKLREVLLESRSLPESVQQLGHDDGRHQDLLCVLDDLPDAVAAPHESRVGARVQQRPHRHADSSTVSKTSSEASNASASSWLHEPNRSSSAEPMFLPSPRPAGRPAPLLRSFSAARLREVPSVGVRAA